ncbi:hypothetical protein [Halomarina rubra]|uniref:Uncharacterized protein n=1 Tax=Halomarina rubra TaxID=2071873 RepID=A0ABD6AWR9_9EURY|nr:hypothetical protein [Halomarina rubra]
MGLADIAAGLEVTSEQRTRGVATVDATDASLAERLVPFADDLPCAPEDAATVVETYAGGESVGTSARAAGLPPMTGAKTLHLLGESVSPLGPTGREMVRDWLDATLPRADALALTGASETEFALAAYVETHDPLAEAREALEGALSPSGDAAVEKRELLGETMSDSTDLR